MNRTTFFLCVLATVCAWSFFANADDEPVFSGPQVGEKLRPFKAHGVFDDADGKAFDYVSAAQGKPLILVFVHKLTRPSHAVTRALMHFGSQRKKDGLFTAAVFLYEDLTAGTERLKGIQRYLPDKASVGISENGIEGPGAYGLNRNMTLTILIAHKNKVTANFAIVQPSVQADVPKILKEAVKLVGGQVPTLAQLGVQRYSAAKKKRMPAGKKTRPGQELPPEVASLLRELIQKSATTDEVDKAAQEIEKLFDKKRETRQQVAQIAQRIMDAGKLSSYGTAKSREYLKKWARQFASRKDR